MDRYSARINLHGKTQRERNLNRLRDNLLNQVGESLSHKDVKLNGVETKLTINSGTKPYFKEFQSLPGQNIVVGDYIEWANRTWLVYEADCDDEVYIDGKIYECNYTQRWQNESGKIIERPSFVLNASAYNNGEERNKTITLATNQFMVYMPLDEETLKLENGLRVFMDYGQESPSTYKLTRPDKVSGKFGAKGVTNFIYTQCEHLPEKDRIDLMLCDYKEVVTLPPRSDESSDSLAEISCKSPVVKIGALPSRFYAIFRDENGNEVEGVDSVWNIESDFEDKLISTIDNSCIMISTDDMNLADEKFKLTLSDSDGMFEPFELIVLIETIF